MPEEFIQVGHQNIALSQIQDIVYDENDVWIYLANDEYGIRLREDEARAFRQWWETNSNVIVYKVM